jgi:hypothetical protein
MARCVGGAGVGQVKTAVAMGEGDLCGQRSVLMLLPIQLLAASGSLSNSQGLALGPCAV